MAGAAEEALVEKSRIAVPYKWSAGLTGSRFLKTVAAERRFRASRCPACEKVFLPPARACGRCLRDCVDGPEVGPRGILLSFTQALYDSPAHPAKRPIYGLIRLDGADTAVLHRLEADSLDALRIGLAVEPVFAADGEPGVLALRCFRPAVGS